MHIIHFPAHLLTQKLAALLLTDEASQLIFLQYEHKGAAGGYPL